MRQSPLRRALLLVSRNLFHLQMLPLMNHGQHLNEVIGFDLVQNPVGVKAQFPHRIFVQFRYLASFAG